MPSGARDVDSYRRILAVGVPLIFSYTGLMIMYFVDGLFLAWYSEEAIAAVVPASMVSHLLKSVFLGIAGYTSIFVAQYVGADRPGRVGAVVWQGIWFSVLAGGAIVLVSFAARPIFDWMGHEPSIRDLEIRYFQIMCWGAPVIILGGVLPGFFSGRGTTRTLMAVQLAGFVFNGFLDYGLIFGRFGLPEWGTAGAAVATVVSQSIVAAVLIMLYLQRRHRQVYATWTGRRFEPMLFWQLLRYGAPNGFRFAMEMAAWTMFIVYVGRIGVSEQTASNIAWRINGLAFFPMMGLSQAVGILVGQGQGRLCPDLSVRCTYRGLLICEIWMLGSAVLFLLIPRQLLGFFHNPDTMTPERFNELAALGVILLRFVALYCVLDSLSMIFLHALSGAGDTRWTFVVSALLNAVFIFVIAVIDRFHRDIYLIWGAATVFLMLQAFVWLARFRGGRWRTMRVIDPELGR